MSRETRYLELPSREQVSLYGTSLRQAVAGAPEVLALDAALAQLDYSAWEREDPGTGAPSYPPRVLLGVFLYAFSLGLRSSRVIESMCQLHAGFRFLAFGLAPDHNTLCRFRTQYGEQLRAAFVETVRLCQREGLVSLAQVAVDGSKVRANRSRKALAAAEAAFAQALEEAAAADDAVRQAEVSEAVAQECARMQTTAGVQPAYNVQVAVEGSHQIIVAQGVSAQANDVGQLQPLVEQVQETCGAAPEQVLADGGYFDQEQVAALEGQGVQVYVPVSETGLGRMRWEAEAQGYRCPEGQLLRFYRERQGKHIYRCTRCARCASKEACRVKGRSKELHVAPGRQACLQQVATRVASEVGQAIYAARRGIVEPVFAHAKHDRGLLRFLLRGRDKAGAEWSLHCILHNLRKWIQHGREPRRPASAAAVGQERGVPWAPCRPVFCWPQGARGCWRRRRAWACSALERVREGGRLAALLRHAICVT